jgi:hypothetical protein
MDRFVKKKQKHGDGNLLKIERGDKLKEIAELSAAAYAVEWSKRQDEIQLLHPRPGFINESAQVRPRCPFRVFRGCRAWPWATWWRK